MRGFRNFKGSDARCPSIHFLFYDEIEKMFSFVKTMADVVEEKDAMF